MALWHAGRACCDGEVTGSGWARRWGAAAERKETDMSFVAVLAGTVIGVFLLRRPLKKHPGVFYALAALLDALYMCSFFVAFPEVARRAIFLLMQKCTLACALFAVVMFIGVFRADSKVGLMLRPVRAELSILACVLTVGHMALYLASFAPRLANGGIANGGFAVFFATAMALLAVLVVLGATSLQGVKRRMDSGSWKRLQKWAYVFFGLVYVHLMSILLPSALAQGTTARTSVVVYTVLFALYAVARIARAVADRKRSAAPLSSAFEGAR